MTHKTFIIAEAGVNHNGSIELAKELVDAAAEAGADAVKFQTFKTEKNITRSAPKAEYQMSTTGASESQFEMVKKLELGEGAHREIASYCRHKKIKFLSTPFDLGSVDLLVSLGVDILKIPSGEVTNAPLMLKVSRTGLPLVISTGMSTLGDIEGALGVVAFGLLGKEEPSYENFRLTYSTPEAQNILKEKVTLLHCTTEYPTPVEDTNLRSMLTMKHAFGLPVGYSDHTLGIVVPVAAVAMGATVIEKHFTMDKTMPGPDHRASLEPNELKAMVKSIREVELALGSGRKVVAPSEEKNINIARRSLTVMQPVAKGELFSEENLGYMRPGNGISPMHYWEYIGKAAERDYQQHEMI